MTPKIEFTGLAQSGNIQQHLTGIQGDYLQAPYDQPLTKQNDSHLGRLYRNYDTPPEETLHFTNRGGQPTADQRHNLALQRPSLNVQKPTMHLPGCRFPRMNALESDFSHPEWEARPWDDDHSTHCGPAYVCGDNEPDFLNCTKTVDVNGNETLVFDNQPFQITGNGLVPDIPSFGEHTLGTDALFSETDVVHKVYMKDADANPAVTLDQVCDYDSSIATDDTIETDKPLFTSHNECGTGVLLDFADGYACVAGPQTYVGDDLGRSGTYDDVLLGLGVPTISGTGAPSSLLFQFGSGIQDLSEITIRFDCGCLLVDCEPTSPGSAICSADTFIDNDEEYDWGCDHLQVDLNLLQEEPIGVCSTKHDGTIPSFLEVL
jgi:hypothetical protein